MHPPLCSGGEDTINQLFNTNQWSFHGAVKLLHKLKTKLKWAIKHYYINEKTTCSIIKTVTWGFSPRILLQPLKLRIICPEFNLYASKLSGNSPPPFIATPLPPQKVQVISALFCRRSTAASKGSGNIGSQEALRERADT